jgi:hypothetical protein
MEFSKNPLVPLRQTPRDPDLGRDLRLETTVVRLSALSTGHLYSQEISLVFISVTGWVDPMDIVRPDGLSQWKIPVTPSGIETATFWLVAQCLK